MHKTKIVAFIFVGFILLSLFSFQASPFTTGRRSEIQHKETY